MLSYNNGDITSIPKVSGTYSIGPNVIGMPFSGGCLAQVASDGYSVAITVWFGNTQYIRVGSGEVWDDWDILATATPPQQFDLPLAEGLIQSSTSWYSKDQFNQVHVHGDISAGSGSLEWDTLVATLPEGYRPGAKIEAPATFASGGKNGSGAVAVSADGTIKVFPDISSTQKVVYFDLVFLASGLG